MNKSWFVTGADPRGAMVDGLPGPHLCCVVYPRLFRHKLVLEPEHITIIYTGPASMASPHKVSEEVEYAAVIRRESCPDLYAVVPHVNIEVGVWLRRAKAVQVALIVKPEP